MELAGDPGGAGARSFSHPIRVGNPGGHDAPERTRGPAAAQAPRGQGPPMASGAASARPAAASRHTRRVPEPGPSGHCELRFSRQGNVTGSTNGTDPYTRSLLGSCLAGQYMTVLCVVGGLHCNCSPPGPISNADRKAKRLARMPVALYTGSAQLSTGVHLPITFLRNAHPRAAITQGWPWWAPSRLAQLE